MVEVHVAVNAFFIVSGFYMAFILNEKYIGKNKSYNLFITNRFMRIFPVYWVVLLLFVIYSSIRADIIFQTYIRNIPSFTSLYFLIKNIFLFSFISMPRSYILDVPAWSLGVELTFYLFAPLITRLKFKKTLLLLLAYLFMDLFLSHTFLNHVINDIQFYFLQSQFTFFVLGILSYWIYTKVKTLNIKKEVVTFTELIIIIYTLFYGFMPFLNNDILANIYYLLIACGIPFFFLNSRKNSVSNFLGELSYPIYISQWLVLYVLSDYIKIVPINKNFIPMFEIIAVLLFSFLLYLVIMKPLDRIRDSRIKKKTIVSPKAIKEIPAYAIATD